MLRFIVTRHWIKHKGKMYHKGEMLPPEFTERDRFHNIYPSRIAMVDVDETPKVPTEVKKAEAPKVEPPKVVGDIKAQAPQASPSPTTGAPVVNVPKNVGLSGHPTK